MEEPLQQAAEDWNINNLYANLAGNQNMLEQDDTPYANTHLHRSAAAGETLFAMEIATLRPSFTRKLNHLGLSPMHLALQNRKVKTVRALMTVNVDLIRVKGRGRVTPLHLAAEIDEHELLAEFLSACPSSIEDLTSKCETAVHVAVKSGKLRSVKVLVGWLMRVKMEEILNWNDEDGNTVLHIATLWNQPERLAELLRNRPEQLAELLENQHEQLWNQSQPLNERLAQLLENQPALCAVLLQNRPRLLELELRIKLVKNWPGLRDVLLMNQPEVIKLLIGRLNVNAKNFDDFTALDLYEQSLDPNNEEVGKILCNANAKRASSLFGVTRLSDHLSQVLAFSELQDRFFNVLGNSSNTKSPRDMILVVAGLVVAATYQAVLSPPGGYWQDNSFPSTNTSTATAGSEGGPHSAGEMIMSGTPLYLFLGYNTVAFLTSACTILVILLGLPFTLMLRLSVYFLLMNYYTSLISSLPYVTLRNYPFVAILGYILVAAGFWVPEYMFSQRKKHHHLIHTPMRRLGNFVIG